MVLVPQVGVVIANHDNCPFVERAILSVAQQTVRDIRVVIVDDASTDRSDELIQQRLHNLGDDRFRYVKLPVNHGQAGALRRGLEKLDTPFVCFLDSDDVWYESFIARHLEAHLNGDFPVAMTYCDSHIIDAHDRLLAGTAWWFDHDLSLPPKRVLDSSRVPTIDSRTGGVTSLSNRTMTLLSEWSPDGATNTMSSMMLRRDFVNLIFAVSERDLRLYVDFYLSTFACLLTGAIAIHEPLYAYRMHGLNKHSDAVVFGGAYNSSTKAWPPIRASILKLILDVLQSQADPIQRAFGDARHAHAIRMVAYELFERMPPGAGNVGRAFAAKLFESLRARFGNDRSQRIHRRLIP